MKMTFCYFGIYNPDVSVNKVTLSGLEKLGFTVVECKDYSTGLQKYFSLYRKHKEIKDSYDVMIVGFPGYIMVPLARLISNRPVIADLVGSLEDADFYSHNSGFLRRIKNRIIDWLVVVSAHAVLLESEAQRKNFEKKFGPSKKYKVVYIGAPESEFYSQTSDTSSHTSDFLVLFRGSLTPESGIFYVLKAAELLKGELDIKFRIIGRGYFLKAVEEYIQKHDLYNVEFISDYLSSESLRIKMQDARVSLGQFESNPRLDTTIPHKAYQSFAMNIPYLSGNGTAVKEIITDGINGFLCELKNPEAIALKIKELKGNSELLKKVAAKAKSDFDAEFSSVERAQKIVSISRSLLG